MFHWRSDDEGLVRGFTTRRGGVSTGPYAALNLGAHVGDDPVAVAQNRRLLAEAVGLNEDRVVYMDQCHGADVAVVTERRDVPPSADALVTAEPDLGLVVMVADCTPVLVHDRRIIATGYNGAAPGRPDCLEGACPRGQLGYDVVPGLGDYDRPGTAGFCIAIHAEVNALLFATRDTKGATAYITDPPCPGCRKALAAAIKPIYTAVNAEAAEAELHAFEAGPWGQKFPTVASAWRRAWDKVIPFFAFPPEVRRVIYTTNAIESVNARLRKIIKTRGHFPSDDAATKLIWLALRNITEDWGRAANNWKSAMNQFAILYEDRFTKSST